MIQDLLIGLILAFVGQSGVIWWRLGRLEAAIKKPCPFGACPLYERAKGEAAPGRTAGEASPNPA